MQNKDSDVRPGEPGQPGVELSEGEVTMSDQPAAIPDAAAASSLTSAIAGAEPSAEESAYNAPAEPEAADQQGGATEGAAEQPREMGEQPLAECLRRLGLKPHDLVVAAPDQLTHKMVARAVRGRWLTRNTMNKVIRAYNQASGEQKKRSDLFNY